MGVYQNFAEYNPVHKVMIFGGGNGSRDLYKMDNAGTITKMMNAPIDLGTTWGSITTIDPMSGDFLIFGIGRYSISITSSQIHGLCKAVQIPFFTPGR